MNLYFKWIASPVGQLKLVATDTGLAAILWEQDSPRRVPLGAMAESPDHPILILAAIFPGRGKLPESGVRKWRANDT